MEHPELSAAKSADSSQGDEDTWAVEARLVEAAQCDPTAFDALYQRYFDRTYRYVRMRVQSQEDAADLTQQVFLQALDSLPRFRASVAPFAAWFFAIVRHVLADRAIRARRRPAPLALENASELVSDLELEASILQRESLERLSALLATLDPTVRDLLALRFAGGLSAPEIAAIIGKRPDAIRKQLSRLLQTLKEQYHVAR